MKKLILLFVLLLFLQGCASSSYTNLNPIEFKNLIGGEDVFLVDVHIPEQEHIEGTHALIPYNQIESNLRKLPKDKNQKIAVYCRSGSMSAEASQKLLDLGYKEVYNLVGGRNAYIDEFGGGS